MRQEPREPLADPLLIVLTLTPLPPGQKRSSSEGPILVHELCLRNGLLQSTQPGHGSQYIYGTVVPTSPRLCLSR